MGRIKKIIGFVSKDVVNQWSIPEQDGKAIIEDMEWYVHIDEHKNEYQDSDSFYYTLDNLDTIIGDPDYVYYNPKKQGLEYYKMLKENVALIVRTSNKEDLVAKTVYPVTDEKIQYRKKREIKDKKKAEKKKQKLLLDKYKYKGNYTGILQ